MNVCTIIARNYIAHARVLARSLREHDPEGTCTVCVIDDFAGEVEPVREPFDIVRPEALAVPRLAQLAASYDVLELSTALKPWLLRRLLEQHDTIVYLDPDIRFYRAPDDIEGLLEPGSLVLNPHLRRPLPSDGRTPSVMDILRAGAYNLGFVGLGRGSATDALLQWWSEQLLDGCLADPAAGYFVDQRWMDLAPGMVDEVRFLRDPSCNVAHWNLPQRELTQENGHYFVDGRPLCFMHFSGFDPRRPNELSVHQDRLSLADHAALKALCAGYAADLRAAGFEEAREWSYGYGTTASGIPLSRPIRRLFAAGVDAGALDQPPFTSDGEAQLMEWLNAPAEIGAAHGVTRFLLEVYRLRPDVRQVHRDLDGPDGRDFVNWCRWYGRDQVPIPDPLLPPKADEIPRPPPEEVLSSLPFGVNLAGYLNSTMGVGDVARRLVDGLDAAEVPVLPVGLAAEVSPREHHVAGAGGAGNPFAINVVCVNADMLDAFAAEMGPHFFAGRHTIGMWWWEVSEFPQRWMSAFDHLEEVWAGSGFVADALAPIAPVPVVRMPVPVTTPPAGPVDRDALGLPASFTFLFMFDHNSVLARKNPVGLVEAFTRAFGPGDGPALVIKSINGERHPADRELVCAAAAPHEHVHLLDHHLPEGDKNALLAACDCFVSLHRSEGFGIGLAESMALGKPVIATRYSGNLDYMTDANAYLVDCSLVPIGPGADPYPASGVWAEPDLDHAARLMRQVVGRPDEAQARARRAAADIARQYAPAVVGEAMRQRLEPLAAKPVRAPRADHGAAKAREALALGPLPPPRSPLGRLGGPARRLILRLMRPHTAHQRHVDDELLHAVEDARRAADAVGASPAVANAQALAEVRRLARTLEQYKREADETVRAEQRLEAGLSSAVGRAERLEAGLSSAVAQEQRAEQERAELTRWQQQSAVRPYMAGEPFESFEQDGLGRVYGYRDVAELPAPGYRAFEDVFRGPEDFIAERQRRYLPLVRDRGPVLDLGCGRGEFLDLLREHGVAYQGVDVDPDMVARCIEKGHEGTVTSDAAAHLEMLADGSVGVVFASHLLEHLAPDVMTDLLALATQKLSPGGLFIAETVNPHSAAALKTFWVDPTHQHPIFPESLLALCQGAGFGTAYVFHPNGSGDAEVDRLEQGEYTVVAERRPASARGSGG